jgi:hypothetical protein
MASKLKYCIRIKDVGAVVVDKVYEIYPRVPAEVGPGFSEAQIEGLKKAAQSALVKRLEAVQAENARAEFVEWWIQDENREVLHRSDVLAFDVPAAN